MEGKSITIKVKHLTDKVYEVEANTANTVSELKEILEQKTSIPAGEQKIIFKGTNLHILFQFSQVKCLRTSRPSVKIKSKTAQQCTS